MLEWLTFLVCVSFLYTVVCIVWLRFGVHLVSKKGILPSLSGHSIVNFMWSSILFICLNRMSTWSISVIQIISSTSLPPWCGNGELWSQCHFFKIFHVNICYDWWDERTHCCSVKLLIKLVLEWEHTVVQHKFQESNNFVYGNVPRRLVVLLVKCVLWFFYLLLPGQHSALTSKETMVSSGLMVIPLILSASPLQSLVKEKFLPVYSWRIPVRNFESL